MSGAKNVLVDHKEMLARETMQKHKPFLFILLILMLVAVQACNMNKSTPTPSSAENDALLAARQTVAAISLTQTGSAPIFSPTASLTFTPTLISTPAFTPTPVYTATPTFPYVTLSVGTNCRSGPDKVFPLIDTFLPGQTIEVLGTNPSGEYWYVRSPNNKNVLCWMWGYYASGGNLNNLFILTSPPSPTPTPAPGFDFSYAELKTCGAMWWAQFNIQNTGGIALESISFSGKDTVTGNLLSDTENDFINNDCSSSSSITKLDPGASATISSQVFTADPTGHKVNMTIKVCTQNDMTGQCISKGIDFTP
jgi:hypothetical protein